MKCREEKEFLKPCIAQIVDLLLQAHHSGIFIYQRYCIEIDCKKFSILGIGGLVATYIATCIIAVASKKGKL